MHLSYLLKKFQLDLLVRAVLDNCILDIFFLFKDIIIATKMLKSTKLEFIKLHVLEKIHIK